MDKINKMKFTVKIILVLVICSISTLASANGSNLNATSVVKVEKSVLNDVFDQYFKLKDALVSTDAGSASKAAKQLYEKINAVEMGKLGKESHDVWMEMLPTLKEDVNKIGESKTIKFQRKLFITLSDNMYKLMKVEKYDAPVYHQYCPMANDGKGANWLSKEKKVQNPYYGSEMMTCGKVIETIN
ncbi:MAG: DUF3347 domain-containing protein [Saprospiraceae bacterium]|nr:DUF3347 domain-containing protein [Saprospiraceae bacterium]